jgi:signal transduction histidine kinase
MMARAPSATPGWRSIRARLVFVVLATTAAALLVAATAMLVYDSRLYHTSLVTDISTQADIVGRASAAALAFEDGLVARENLSLLKAKPGVSAAALYNAKGALFAAYRRDDSAAADLPKLPEGDGYRIEGDTLVVFKRVVENREILGTIFLRADYALHEHRAKYLAIMAAVLAGALVVAFAISAWLQSTISKPILAIRDVARDVVEKRDFSLRARRTTNDEVGYLADAFNDMLSEIGSRTVALQQSNETLALADEDLKKLNAQLEERVVERTSQLAQANQELESFSYSVSHDLRAPVRAIAGFSKLLAEQNEQQLDDEAKRKLNIVRSEAARMGTLIDDLLAFSRLGRQSLQMRSVDMEELVRMNFQTLSAQYPAGSVELRVEALPHAIGDRSLLAQVWANLLSNALKFSAKRDKPAIEVNAIADEREFTYFVRDNGAGFDPRYTSKLFGVFQRLHDSAEFAGTGVGLALVHRIVTRHGGRVWAEGKPDAGATFYFTLPREQK